VISPRPTILQELAELNPNANVLEGMEDALIGIVANYDWPVVAVYDIEAIQDVLLAEGKTVEAADEFIELYLLSQEDGEKNGPIFVRGS